MKVAVVILNWNGKKLLEQFLPSVVNYSKDQANIYVADNASMDDSVKFISENFSEVKIIQNTVNGGFAKGYNDALRGLSEELFVLLNSDVEVTPNWLTPLLREFESDPRLVAAQPKILDYHRKDHFEYAGAAGGFIDYLGYPYCRGRIFDSIEKDEGQYNDVIPIFWATGACLVVKNEAYFEAGQLDEDLFAHQEEIDLCWRLQSNGGTIKYVGHSTVFHVGGATLGAANPKKTYYNFRNSLLFMLKNLKGNEIWSILFTRLILDAFAGLRFLLQGKVNHFIAIIQAHFGFYRLFSKFLRKRKQYAKRLPYYEITSVAWDYFIRKKRTFNEL